ncbi:LysR substrate-binding domain-containing protein [Plantactinospora mayteni]|uniref:LysR family transcriptional regulator n=1 Tax=Plantactinospora mayteni TaxID=566021 RepID=A0ABQ4F4A2_9ACTN|nr:LysR substrate-binding domain-containing protein [Plantactinospora mayteni]GIH01739.1 LysR family transcriptional regulator [Plantactinospora mayteni]
MELRQLEYFVAVAEEASFTRAAERVRISQSGVSAQVRQLERELGATLIDRSTRTTTLTAAGRAALEHARATLAAADTIRQAVGEVTGLIRGQLTVGMIIGCTVTPLFEALEAFHRAHPQVELTLLEGNSDRLVESVRSATIDLALVGTAEAPAGLNALTIVSERLVALVPPEHPLARQETIGLADIAEHPVVCMPEGTGIRTVFDRACAARRVQPTIALQASAAATIADLATRGLGVAILSESLADEYEDRLTALRVSDVDGPALLALVWAATQSPALARLVRNCRDAFAATPA